MIFIQAAKTPVDDRRVVTVDGAVERQHACERIICIHRIQDACSCSVNGAVERHGSGRDNTGLGTAQGCHASINDKDSGIADAGIIAVPVSRNFRCRSADFQSGVRRSVLIKYEDAVFFSGIAVQDCVSADGGHSAAVHNHFHGTAVRQNVRGVQIGNTDTGVDNSSAVQHQSAAVIADAGFNMRAGDVVVQDCNGFHCSAVQQERAQGAGRVNGSGIGFPVADETHIGGAGHFRVRVDVVEGAQGSRNVRAVHNHGVDDLLSAGSHVGLPEHVVPDSVSVVGVNETARSGNIDHASHHDSRRERFGVVQNAVSAAADFRIVHIQLAEIQDGVLAVSARVADEGFVQIQNRSVFIDQSGISGIIRITGITPVSAVHGNRGFVDGRHAFCIDDLGGIKIKSKHIAGVLSSFQHNFSARVVELIFPVRGNGLDGFRLVPVLEDAEIAVLFRLCSVRVGSRVNGGSVTGVRRLNEQIVQVGASGIVDTVF